MDDDGPATTELEQPEQLWRDLTIWFEDIAASIERELIAGAGLTEAEFQVLAALAAAPDRSLTQLQLRQELNWSPSRLSHQLRRMRARGYCDTSELGHGTRMQVVLTAAGAAAYTTGRDVHQNAVAAHLLNKISPQHRTELRRAVARGRSSIRTDDPNQI